MRFVIKAVGDSCVIHGRDATLLDSFPLSDADQFNNSPALLPSNLQDPDDIEKLFVTKEGTFFVGDRFLLLTDAIACWTLRSQSDKGDAINSLLEVEEQTQLETLVANAREELDQDDRPQMGNDDVTLISVEVTVH